jgi:hypothetical protein
MRKKHINYLHRSILKNPFHLGMDVGTRFTEIFQWEPAVVIDVVTNDQHPEYAEDGYNVGVIKFRFIESQDIRPEESLNYAFPIDANVTRYPLKNELVFVVPALNRFYYTTVFNISNRPTAHAIPELRAETGPPQTRRDLSKQYDENSSGGAPIKNDTSTDAALGKTFKDKENVFRLRSQEGDIIIEGRTGQSIRLGSNPDKDHAPNMLIRVGQSQTPKTNIPNSPFALVDEDINGDGSSIWMVTDQVIPLTFATVNDQTHFRSMEQKPSVLSGRQIVINTDRLVINTRRDRLLVSTFLGTHFSTLQDHTVDAAQNYRSFVGKNRQIEAQQDYLITLGRDYLLKVGRNFRSDVQGKTEQVSSGTHAIVGKRVYIGSLSNDEEPLVLGEQLRKLLLEFVDAHLNNAASHVLPTVGIGPLAPGTIAALQRVREQLVAAKAAPFESRDNFVTKTNG